MKGQKHYAIQVSIQHFQTYDFALQFIQMLVSEFRLLTSQDKTHTGHFSCYPILN
jgi:hypothetical protein